MKHAIRLVTIITLLLFIAFIGMPTKADTHEASDFNHTLLAELTLPQPREIIAGKMQPAPIPVPLEPTPTPAQNYFSKILKTVVNKPTPTPTPIATKPIRQTKKPIVTIAAIGDSMVDTMGTYLPYLGKQLEAVYTNTNFIMFNYGVGSTNIDSGLARLTDPLSYQGRDYESPISLNPDIIIIESFAYNPLPLSQENLGHHQSTLATMVNMVRSQTQADIFLLATVAPHHTLFGTGPAGVNWSSESISQHTEAIHAYLENTINTAEASGVPIIDAFHPSQDGEGNGRLSLINPGDHIHLSAAGQNFVAQKITQTIAGSKVLE